MSSADAVRQLGVEEEFQLIDVGTRRLAPRAPELLARLPQDTYVGELQRCVIEVNSDVHPDLSELRADLVRRRSQLVAAAAELGLGVAAAGAVPLSVPAELQVTETPRYRRMLADYQLLARPELESIVIEGRKGGSALAAACVNALAEMALRAAP